MSFSMDGIGVQFLSRHPKNCCPPNRTALLYYAIAAMITTYLRYRLSLTGECGMFALSMIRVWLVYFNSVHTNCAASKFLRCMYCELAHCVVSFWPTNWIYFDFDTSYTCWLSDFKRLLIIILRACMGVFIVNLCV